MQMAALRYRRFLKVCEEWPVDETRRGRDLGAFLRQRVAQAFKEGENTQIQDLEACDEMYESLSRLNSNYYREKYPRLQDTSFTEITVDEYRMVLATDSLKQMDEMKKGMWKRLKDKFNVKSPQDDVKE
ncbi:ubiquinol-cytochrome-c reductase complex assembly factor 2 [Bufo gargarizans]|uniref:ubiquinol-cytochrome-c reductase complex assembly factor 2 n=1 Tax=Bufo gargarizans TaxID=30331 RepID=UPI001CF5BA2B|nr:ubiquinol-cytochrome-c reductase complex assembly factor 2 [Bufo gargarizans]